MKKFNLDKETIDQLGLYPSQEQINAPSAPDARIFQFHELKDVYLMESDLYGNTMPQGSCFLAFQGRDGLLGKHILIETLKKCTLADIKKIVENNHDG
ncbi:MAG TPA: hypothetical protein VGE06_11895 [Flavisolibacter sp.]